MDKIYYWLGAVVFWILVVVIAIILVAIIYTFLKRLYERTWLNQTIHILKIHFKYIKPNILVPADIQTLQILQQLMQNKKGEFRFTPWRKWFLRFVTDQIDRKKAELLEKHGEVY